MPPRAKFPSPALANQHMDKRANILTEERRGWLSTIVASSFVRVKVTVRREWNVLQPGTGFPD